MVLGGIAQYFTPAHSLYFFKSLYLARQLKYIWVVLISDWRVKICEAGLQLIARYFSFLFFFFPLHLLVLFLFNKLPVIIWMFLWRMQYFPSVLFYFSDEIKLQRRKKSTCFSVHLEMGGIRLLVGQTWCKICSHPKYEINSICVEGMKFSLIPWRWPLCVVACHMRMCFASLCIKY